MHRSSAAASGASPTVGQRNGSGIVRRSPSERYHYVDCECRGRSSRVERWRTNTFFISAFSSAPSSLCDSHYLVINLIYNFLRCDGRRKVFAIYLFAVDLKEPETNASQSLIVRCSPRRHARSHHLTANTGGRRTPTAAFAPQRLRGEKEEKSALLAGKYVIRISRAHSLSHLITKLSV